MKSKNFIKKAEYPGGAVALRKFIKQTLRYPKEALLHRVEGRVYLKYEVSEKGIESKAVNTLWHDKEKILRSTS